MVSNNNTENEKQEQKKQAKAYENYVKQFTPRPKYFKNGIKAFIIGGLVCMFAYYLQSKLMDTGMGKTDAGIVVTVILICAAQLLTGFGWYDSIAKFAGAGVIVPITGFANSMVAPAIEFKKEGLVLGVGSKLFTIAGPVLVSGISSSVIVGIIYWFFTK
ncbi:MAG: stage V sporulation protein AC [Anaerovoracaceae bacterium]|jgi:stage V sporulation protein AC